MGIPKRLNEKTKKMKSQNKISKNNKITKNNEITKNNKNLEKLKNKQLKFSHQIKETQLKEKLNLLSQSLDDKMEENSKLKNSNFKNQLTLDEEILGYKKVLAKFSNLENENLALKKRVDELQNENRIVFERLSENDKNKIQMTRTKNEEIDNLNRKISDLENFEEKYREKLKESDFLAVRINILENKLKLAENKKSHKNGDKIESKKLSLKTDELEDKIKNKRISKENKTKMLNFKKISQEHEIWKEKLKI